ncbi:MAG TPA: PD-(D/E)XK nuclease family protein, partial [Acidothermaceae bacterium]
MTAVELAEITADAGEPARSGEQDQPRPWSLSPSRAGDFMTCPLLYRLRVIDRLPEPSSPVTARGTLVHGVLERLFDSPAPERTLDRAASLLEPEWQRLLEERPELIDLFASVEAPAEASTDEACSSDAAAGTDDAVSAWLASARVLLETYFALEDPTRIEPAQR